MDLYTKKELLRQSIMHIITQLQLQKTSILSTNATITMQNDTWNGQEPIPNEYKIPFLPQQPLGTDELLHALYSNLEILKPPQTPLYSVRKVASLFDT